MSRPVGDWPALGSVHKNGDRIVGREIPHAADLYRAGTPGVWNLLRASVLPAMSEVRIDDVLDVSFDGARYWQVTADGVPLGRLTWTAKTEGPRDWLDYEIRYPRSGTLVVSALILDRAGSVVNCGGIVTPS